MALCASVFVSLNRCIPLFPPKLVMLQNRLGVLFFRLLYLSLMSLSSLPIWRDERLLFIRERAAGLYRTPAYFTAVVLFDLLPLRVRPIGRPCGPRLISHLTPPASILPLPGHPPHLLRPRDLPLRWTPPLLPLVYHLVHRDAGG